MSKYTKEEFYRLHTDIDPTLESDTGGWTSSCDKVWEWIEQAKQEAREDGEIALARKVLGVANYTIPVKGMTMRVRLDLLRKKMNEIIPDDCFIDSDKASILAN